MLVTIDEDWVPCCRSVVLVELVVVYLFVCGLVRIIIITVIHTVYSECDPEQRLIDKGRSAAKARCICMSIDMLYAITLRVSTIYFLKYFNLTPWYTFGLMR